MDPQNDFLQSRSDTGVLLPYQRRWLEDKATVKICEKSRRVGLSWVEAADDTLYSSQESGDDTWYIGYNKDMAVEFVSDCGNWAKHYQLAASAVEEEIFRDEDKDILTYKITFSSGHRITALSSRPTNLRGKQGRVVIDEAAFHDNLQQLIKAAMALTMWGGQVRLISTHFGVDNPFNELIAECRAGKRPYSVHRITLDDALAKGLYRRICQVLGREWSPQAEAAWREELISLYSDAADEELFCIPSQSSGVYLSRAMIEKGMSANRPVLRLSCTDEFGLRAEPDRRAEIDIWIRENLAPLLVMLDPNQKHFIGQDVGRSQDLSVATPLARLANLRLVAPFSVEMRNVPFAQQRQILFRICDALPNFSGGAIDARGIGANLAEDAADRYGASRISKVMLTQQWYIDNMPPVKAAFEDGEIEIPKDADQLDDLRMIVQVKGVPHIPDNKKIKGSDGKPRHGDSAIALVLAKFATAIDAGPVTYESKPRESTQGLGRGAY